MNQEKINFQQSRDFGETFNVSVKFLRQNFKLFFQCVLFIAGPFVLISAIAGAFYQSHAISIFSLTRLGAGAFQNILQQFGWAYLLFILATMLASLALMTTVYSFMIIYRDKGPDGFTVNDVQRVVISNIGNVLAVFFTFTLLILLILVVMVGLIIGIGSAIPVLGILLAFFLVIGMLIVFPPIMWQLSATYLVKMTEQKGVFESFGRTRQVMRDNFWWTWVIIVCSLMAVGLAGIIFTLPQAGYQMVLMFTHLKDGSGETPVAFLIVATICTFCSTLLYSTISVIMGFHYFSLAEKKDGTGLMERINEIGHTPSNNDELHY